MSDGPYKITEKAGEGWYVHGLPGSILKGCLRHEREEAENLAGLLNLAHAHATEAAARRVRELEEALSWAAKLDSEHKDNCPVPDHGLRAMYRQKWREAYARAALAGKERTDGE